MVHRVHRGEFICRVRFAGVPERNVIFIESNGNKRSYLQTDEGLMTAQGLRACMNNHVDVFISTLPKLNEKLICQHLDYSYRHLFRNKKDCMMKGHWFQIGNSPYCAILNSDKYWWAEDIASFLQIQYTPIFQSRGREVYGAAIFKTDLQPLFKKPNVFRKPQSKVMRWQK